MFNTYLRWFKKTITAGVTGGLAILMLQDQRLLDYSSDKIEQFTLQYVNNPKNSKTIEEEKKFIKSMTPKIAIEKYDFDKFREKFFELIPHEKIAINKRGKEELEKYYSSLRPKVFELTVMLKQCKNLLYNLRKEQNMKELQLLRFKKEEEKLIARLSEMQTHQYQNYTTVSNQVKEYEDLLVSSLEKVDEKTNEYIKEIENFENSFKEGKFEPIEKLRKEYLECLKSFEINVNTDEEKERLFNDNDHRKLLENKYAGMIQLHKEFKEKEVDILREILPDYSNKLLEKCDEVLEVQKIYEQTYKHLALRKNELEQYKDAIFQLTEVEESFYQNKSILYGNRVKDCISSIAYEFETQTKPDLLKIFDQRMNALKLDLSKFFFNNNLVLPKNYKFLDGIYTTRTKESLSLIRFIMHKFNKDNPFYEKVEPNLPPKNIYYTTDTGELKDLEKTDGNGVHLDNPLSYSVQIENKPEFGLVNYENLNMFGKDIYLNPEQTQNLKNNLLKNYIRIGKFAKKFNDEFIRNLVEISINRKIENTSESYVNKDIMRNFVTKHEIESYLDQHKYDMLFELFYDYDIFEEKKNPKTLKRFMTSFILSEMGTFWMNFFNFDYSLTSPEKKDFINQLKALNYILNYIEKEDYIKAYSNFVHVHPHNKYINGIKHRLESLAKNQIFCDIVETHIEGSQNYRDGKDLNVYKI